mmetsp:Transcript_24958/g.81240  ORF Transcript_24958/g.81240 Transcript_24958/m.81240 type:complete len:227 (-) Transcript_24958:26-706(-)
MMSRFLRKGGVRDREGDRVYRVYHLLCSFSLPRHRHIHGHRARPRCGVWTHFSVSGLCGARQRGLRRAHRHPSSRIPRGLGARAHAMPRRARGGETRGRGACQLAPTGGGLGGGGDGGGGLGGGGDGGGGRHTSTVLRSILTRRRASRTARPSPRGSSAPPCRRRAEVPVHPATAPTERGARAPWPRRPGQRRRRPGGALARPPAPALAAPAAGTSRRGARARRRR